MNPRTYAELIRKHLSLMDFRKVELIADRLFRGWIREKQVFTMGNGGSMATASHFASDLCKSVSGRKKDLFRVISLSDNTPLLTALANDFGYERVFEKQLENSLRAGDFVIALSASGNSPNLVRAVRCASRAGAETVALVGFDGGKLKKIAGHCLHIPENNYAIVEDIHLILTHMICSLFKKKLNSVFLKK
ncbi:MAG TPA: SIS domain-containing protein [bacterium]|nr:SIS domain-containing protein [bacterium]